MSEIHVGLCQCGCGQPTRPTAYDDRRYGLKKGDPRRYLQGHQHSGKNNSSWRGGRFVRTDGYVAVYAPEHPACDGTHVLEHIVVAERALGRYLPPGAVVHHVNENKSDNRSTNLVVCENRDYHNLVHSRMRALAACGRADWLKCNYCGAYDDPANLSLSKRTRSRAWHRSCAATYSREAKARRRATAQAARARTSAVLPRQMVGGGSAPVEGGAHDAQEPQKPGVAGAW